jgi:hypothetical protein
VFFNPEIPPSPLNKGGLRVEVQIAFK